MPWEAAALVCAAGFALKGFFCKAACRAGADELGLMFWTTALSSAGFGLALFLTAGRHALPDTAAFGRVLAFCASGAVAANICYFKAIRAAPLSVAMPVLALSPALMILTSRWMLGEMADAAGIAGILAVVSGVAVLYAGGGAGELSNGEFKRGFVYALATAVLWSVTSNLDKLAVSRSDPLLYSFAIQTLLMPVFGGGIRILRPGAVSQAMGTPGVRHWIVGAAAMDVLVLGAQMTAILETHVAYVIAVKRSGAILAVLLGWKLFGETQVLRRALACVLILSGAAVLLLTH